MMQYLLTKTGLLTPTVVESGGFVDTAGTGEPDISFMCCRHSTALPIGRLIRAMASPDRALRPATAIARVRPIGSPNPTDAMLCSSPPALAAEQADVETLVRGV